MEMVAGRGGCLGNELCVSGFFLIIPWMKKTKREGMIYKVDIEKAYDSISWDYIESVLSQMEFPELWRKWVMAIVRSARTSVLVNGSPTQEFVGSRGIRQGDPLSPFLFVLVMESLTGVMKKAESIGLFKGVTIPDLDKPLSHFLYADDVVFIGEWSLQNMSNLKRILRCFYLVSGLKVNHSKSNIYGIGVDDLQVQVAADLMGCARGALPFKYLGLQVGANMNLLKSWDPVIDIFKKRLALWKAKMISYGGRITLLKSVLNALPTYYFSIYKAPLGVIKKLERIRREFFWGYDSERSKMKWVAWRKFMIPKHQGGMGFGSLRMFNLALLTKWWWRFKTDRNGLWRKVIWGLHKGSNIWNFVPVKKTVTGPWKQIGNLASDFAPLGINLLLFFRAYPGLEKQVSFWKENWMYDSPLCEKFPLLFELEQNKNVLISERFESRNGITYWIPGWRRLPSTVGEVAELSSLTSTQQNFIFGSSGDKWVWNLDQSGEFSVKSFKTECEKRCFQNIGSCFEWNNWAPIKVNVFLWRLIHDGVPTTSALVARSITIQNQSCILCNEDDESAVHLFGSCRITEVVWELISRWCRIRPIIIFEVKDIPNIHKSNRGSKRWCKAVDLVIQTTIWTIWRNRNAARFEGRKTSVGGIIDEIKTWSYVWIKNRAGSGDLSWTDWCSFNLGGLGI